MQARAHYWIEDEHLLCQPIGSRQVWGVHLGELHKARAKAGSGSGPTVLSVKPIGVKRKRLPAKKKGKERVEGPPLKREKGESERVVELPPELIEHIMLMALPNLREPTLNNRRIVRGELEAGTTVAEALGNAELMKAWWLENFRNDVDEKLKWREVMALRAAMTAIDFARFWYPLMLNLYDEVQLRDLYVKARAVDDIFDPTFILGHAIAQNGVAIILETLRRKPYTLYQPPVTIACMELDSEIRQMLLFYQQYEPEIMERGGPRMFLQDELPTDVALGVWEDPTGEVSLEAYDEYVELLRATDDEEELQQLLSDYSGVENFRENLAYPMIFDSLKVIRIVREIPEGGYMSRSDYVAFIRLVVFTTYAQQGKDRDDLNWYFSETEGLGLAVERIRKDVKPLLKKHGVHPWWEAKKEEDGDDDQGPATAPEEEEETLAELMEQWRRGE